MYTYIYVHTPAHTHTSEVTNGDILTEEALPDQGGHIKPEGVRSPHTSAHDFSDEGVVLFVQLLLLCACIWIHTYIDRDLHCLQEQQLYMDTYMHTGAADVYGCIHAHRSSSCILIHTCTHTYAVICMHTYAVLF